MKKVTLIILGLFLAFPFFIATKVSAYEGGLLNGETFYAGATWNDKTVSTNLITDNDETTYFEQHDDIHEYLWYEFSEPQDIVAYRFKVNTGSRIYFINAAGNSLGYITGTTLITDGTKTAVNYKGVKKVAIKMTVFNGISNVAEFDVFSDNVPPAMPIGLQAVSDIETVKLMWESNSDLELLGYNIYVNSTKINDIPVLQNFYDVTNLIADINYAFQITAVGKNGLESIKTQVVYAIPMSKVIKPTLRYIDIQSDRVRLSWDSVGQKYEVYKDGVLISRPDYMLTNIDVSGLQPNTEYSFQVIAIDKYNRRNESNVLTVKTLVGVPSKPNLTIRDVTHESARVFWTPTQYTNDYSLYVNDSLVVTQTELSYSLSNLLAETIYRVKVVANGSEGSAQTELSFTTLAKPVPTINSAAVANHPIDLNKRVLTYKATPDVTAVRVYLDGKLLGEYPVSQNEIELDYSEITGIMADIKVEPVEENGKAFTLLSPVKSTGSAHFDTILSKFLSSLTDQRNAFLYLALISIPLFIIVAIFFFLRPKFKTLVGRSKDDNKPFGMVNQANKKAINTAAKQFNVDRTPDERKVYQPPKFRVVEEKVTYKPVGFMGMSGYKRKVDRTYERNGIQYKRRYVKGQGMAFVPKDTRNQIKHVSHQFKAAKSFLTGSNKKQF